MANDLDKLNRQDRDKAAYRKNANDEGIDRRVADLDAHSKLDQIKSNGSLLAGIEWDYVKVTYPLATTEVYTFKTGGSGGTDVATVTVVYTDASKANLDEVTRTTP
jgi:hypothetical protein